MSEDFFHRLCALFFLQISHHPPVSAFYVTNRQDGFNISGSILAKSKFYGEFSRNLYCTKVVFILLH